MSVDGRIFRMRNLFSYKFAGAGSISSAGQNAVTKLNGTPAALRVFVFDASTFEIAFIVTSNDDGTWELPSVDDSREYLAICRDPSKTLNSQARDWMVPE